ADKACRASSFSPRVSSFLSSFLPTPFRHHETWRGFSRCCVQAFLVRSSRMQRTTRRSKTRPNTRPGENPGEKPGEKPAEKPGEVTGKTTGKNYRKNYSKMTVENPVENPKQIT